MNSHQEQEEEQECPICMDLLQSPCAAIVPCDHCFCAPCIQGWIQQSNTCPCCRGKVEGLASREELDAKLQLVSHSCPHRRCTIKMNAEALKRHVLCCEWRQERVQEKKQERIQAAITEMEQRNAGDVRLVVPAEIFLELGEHQLLFDCISKAIQKDDISTDIQNMFLVMLMHDRIAQGQYTIVCDMYRNFHMNTQGAKAAYALALVYQEQYKKAKKVIKSVHHRDWTGDLLTVLGLIYKKQNRYDRALCQLECAMKKPNDGFLHLLLRRTLGDVYRKQGKLARAQEHYQYVWMNMDDNDLEEAELCCCMGKVEEQQGHYRAAISHYKSALKRLPTNHPLLGVYKVNLADAEREQSYFAAARRDYETGIQLIKERLGSEHVELMDAYLGLGSLYKKYQEYETAFSWNHEALMLAEMKLNDHHYKRGLVYKALGDVCRKIRKFNDALEWFEKAWNIVRDSFSLQEAEILHDMGRIYCELQQYEDAKSKVTLAHTCARINENDEKQALYSSTLAFIYGMTDEFAKADELFDSIKPVLDESLGSQHVEVADFYMNRAEIIMRQLQLNRNKEQIAAHTARAIQYCKEAKDILERVYGAEHPKVSTLDTYLCICNTMHT